MRLSITLALFALALHAHAAPFAHLRRQIVAEVEQRNVPAFAVAVVQGNRIIWEEGFGDGVTARTPFALASVSKPITATALMVLAERGKIDLDQPIDHYLGGVRVVGRDGDPAQATVRRVASHTAGLPLHHRFFTAGMPDFEQTAARYAMVVRPPGTAYQYSNLGYRLIERALETVTGEPLGDVLRREVFAPLGMDDASFPADPPYRSDHPGGSDIYASAHDLARFAAFHLGALMPGQQEILSRRARDLMHRPHTPRGDDEPHDYGIGWLIEENVIGHTGGMPGVRAAIYLMPARKLAVITLAACETDLTERIARQVLARYDRSPRAKQTTPAMGKRSPRRLRGAWSGTVDVAGAEVPLSLTVERRAVVVRLGGQERRAIDPRFSRSSVSAWVSGVTLPSADLTGRTMLQVKLELRDGRLRGTATAFGISEDSLPFALGHWVDLGRWNAAEKATNFVIH